MSSQFYQFILKSIVSSLSSILHITKINNYKVFYLSRVKRVSKQHEHLQNITLSDTKSLIFFSPASMCINWEPCRHASTSNNTLISTSSSSRHLTSFNHSSISPNRLNTFLEDDNAVSLVELSSSFIPPKRLKTPGLGLTTTV